MSWQAKAKLRFAELRDPGSLVAIKECPFDVPVYYWRQMSLGERRAIDLVAKGGADTFGGVAMAFIQRCRNEHGQRLFRDDQFDDVLANYHPDDVIAVVAQMAVDAPPDLEDEEKK